MGIDFGSLKETPESVVSSKPRKNYKKMYENLQAAFALSNENNSGLQEEIGMLRQQEAAQKKAIDILTLQAEQFKFRPHQYSEIARLLICMRVRGNKSQKEQVLKIVGSTAIEDVRDHIFKLLEAPYQ